MVAMEVPVFSAFQFAISLTESSLEAISGALSLRFLLRLDEKPDVMEFEQCINMDDCPRVWFGCDMEIDDEDNLEAVDNTDTLEDVYIVRNNDSLESFVLFGRIPLQRNSVGVTTVYAAFLGEMSECSEIIDQEEDYVEDKEDVSEKSYNSTEAPSALQFVNITVDTYTSKCLFWDSSMSYWSTDGCWVE